MSNGTLPLVSASGRTAARGTRPPRTWGLRTLGPIRAALRAGIVQARRPLRWWVALTPAERVLYRSAALLSVGFGMVALPLALIVPGALFALVFFGFGVRRQG